MFIVTLTRSHGLPKVKATYNTFNYLEAVEIARMMIEIVYPPRYRTETCDLRAEIKDNFGASREELTVTIHDDNSMPR